MNSCIRLENVHIPGSANSYKYVDEKGPVHDMEFIIPRILSLL